VRTRRLIVVTPEGERELLFIGRLTVGRAPECDISLADTKISRRHAEFDASGPTPRVTDLGSRNGILVNGRKVGAADLMPGDVITVGDAQVRFEERATETAERAPAAPVTDDRTAVLSPIMPPGFGPPAGVPGSPADLAAEDLPLAPPSPEPVLSSDPDRTSVLPRQAMAPPAAVRHDAPPAPPPAGADAQADRTTVLPPPPRVAMAPPAAADPGRTARLDASPVSPAPRGAPPRVGPPPVALAPPPVAAVPPAAPPAAVAAPAPAVAASAPGGSSATGAAVGGPRFSWGGVVTLASVVLGGLAVLLGALPSISASAGALDALSQRQARTLAGWLAAGVDPQATAVVSSTVLESVLAQPGVERAMVLERATGRAVAPSSLGGRTFTELPGVGEGWRDITAPQVGRVDAFADAYVPAGGGAYVAWVRYERPSSNDTGLAVVVALIATLVLAMLIAMLIKRHTRATLQHFTRQVELAVSGASPKVMQGGLIPGLERLPGVVTYLLERKAGAVRGHGAAGLIETDDPDLGPAAAAAPIDPGPPWLEVTPSLQVAESSAHGPAAGAAAWSTARGRHLLDVLDNGPLRNAVVQGLGALGMQTGAEATVPLGDAPPIVLRREASGHVRVTLAAR
jgi:pSer/pThr/pTyr-binding forkhead associated (FHA) protein